MFLTVVNAAIQQGIARAQSRSYSYSPADDIARYEGFFGHIQGWILSLFGYAFCIYDDKKYFYIRVSDLVTRLCDTSNPAISGKMLATSTKLNRLALETFNPVMGRKIQYKEVTELFRDFRSSEFIQKLEHSNNPSLSADLAECQFEKLKNRHLQILTFSKDSILKNLKPGDIIFKKMPHESTHIVCLGQWIARPFIMGTKERESYKYSHTAIYLGQGKIAEAVPDSAGAEVRILDIEDSHFALEPASLLQYTISRPADEQLGKEAAEIAGKIADTIGLNKKNQPTRFKYSKWQALRSIWHPSGFGPMARYRYIKQYINDHQSQLPKDFVSLKSFFCSYFVSFSYQTAESRKVMPKILGAHDEPLKGLTNVGSAIFRGIWARFRRIQTWKQMSENVKLQFDAKRLTPQDFRNFVVNHPEQFRDVHLIKAPSLAST